MSSPANQVPVTAASSEIPPLRFVTAASLFDGHDAAINIMRRIIQSQGAEVIHLGHNRSVEDVVRAALQEDADAIALSSYQGGHIEYFKYMIDMLRERGAGHVRVFGGGGGTITPDEIAELQAYGVEHLYHPNDGMKLGLVEMIEDVTKRAAAGAAERRKTEPTGLPTVDIDDEISIGHMISALEQRHIGDADLARLRKEWALAGKNTPVIGLTGTGGAGKSSVVDELLLRFLHAFPD
ncbi:MAG: cobalamin-dependent protein, partial [Rhodanobacter sp.]